MNITPKDGQYGGEALQATQYAKGSQPAPSRDAASGSAQIASVVLPFLERMKDELRETNLRLDFGVRKFDVATGENWSVYFRVVNTQSHKASPYYIVDLSFRSPLIIMADSLDVGSAVRSVYPRPRAALAKGAQRDGIRGSIRERAELVGRKGLGSRTDAQHRKQVSVHGGGRETGVGGGGHRAMRLRFCLVVK